MNDIFKDMQANVGCEYISDLPSYKRKVWVENDKLSEALKALTEKKRNIILLSYFMDMADGEISHFINLPRSNVQYHRTKTLETLRKYMEEHK